MDIEKLIKRLKCPQIQSCPMDGEYPSCKACQKSIQQEVTTALSTLQAENEKLRAELERMKGIMRYNGIMVIPSKYPGGRSEWNIPKPRGQKED